MARHDVSFAIPQKFVLSKDVEFNVRSNEAKLGTLLISKGNIEWVPASNTVRKYRLTWEAFADFMESKGTVRKMR
ncbi:hypothetical protein BURK1_00436 [Burkholderiales bacterium]|nr:hypothetical protein BURK1_00436 [Burkholderiales bacterium]